MKIAEAVWLAVACNPVSAASTTPIDAAVPVIEATKPASNGARNLGRLVLLALERNHLWHASLQDDILGDLHGARDCAAW